jgi:hypothetical protein
MPNFADLLELAFDQLEELQVERLAAAKRLQSIEVALTQARVAVRKQNGGQVRRPNRRAPTSFRGMGPWFSSSCRDGLA